MPYNTLTVGRTAAALGAFFVLAGLDVAQAARCPLGEIYRPSRGICVSKQQAVHAGIYRASSNLRTEPASGLPQSPPIDAAPTPRPRPLALAAIERRAPATVSNAERSLAFRNDPKSAQSPIPTLPTPANVFGAIRPAPSPFGGLVALEPMP